ncbi:hypothetical protein [Viridibacillus arvi]|uniref:hypothetical protein n=1 Tax=Viridibacillus arvi TaxID=263475 RepID=UPI0034CEFB6C
MPFIMPFETNFCGKTQTVYAVNSDNPTREGSSVTTSEECPNCKERHIYQVYNEKDIHEEDGYEYQVYDCKCPSCRKEFDLKIEFAIDSD